MLGDAGVYFDPEVSASIADALRRLAADDSLRSKLAELAWYRAQAYSWERCAKDTFEFIAQAVKKRGNVNV